MTAKELIDATGNHSIDEFYTGEVKIQACVSGELVEQTIYFVEGQSVAIFQDGVEVTG